MRTAWLYGAAGEQLREDHAGAGVPARRRSRWSTTKSASPPGAGIWRADYPLASSDARPGVYHGTNSGQTSWFGFTRRIFELIGADPQRVLPTTTDQFPRPAPRPAYSVLGHDRWAQQGLPEMRPWDEALAEALPLLTAAMNTGTTA